MDYTKLIIDYCIENRVSTTEVADALGKKGVITNSLPINVHKYRTGPVRVIFTANNSNYAVHEEVKKVNKGEVVIIFAHNCDGRAIVGDLVTKYVLLYKGASALVVQGLVRDAAELSRQQYAIWAEGVTPLGCFNTPNGTYPESLQKNIRKEFEGGIAICDDGGVTVIPRYRINSDMLSRLRQIEMQEDIWYFCLDTLKWDTKKIVCDKAYLTEQELLSNVHIEQLRKLSKPLDENE